MTFNKLTFEEQAIISMKRKKMTLNEVARKLDVSAPYVSDIIKGNRKGGEVKEKIIRLLDLEE